MYLIEADFEVHSEVHPREGVLVIRKFSTIMKSEVQWNMYLMYLIEVHFEVHSEVHPKEGVLTISYYNQPPQSPHFEVFKFSILTSS